MRLFATLTVLMMGFSPAPTPLISDDQIAWVYAVDRDLGRALSIVEMEIEGQAPQQTFVHLAFLGAMFVCLLHQQNCNEDVIEMYEECLQDCVDECPPGSEDCDLGSCQTCCGDTRDEDQWHCLACGVDGPESEGYEGCWSHMNHHHPDEPPAGRP